MTAGAVAGMLRRWPARAPAVHTAPMPRPRVTLKLATSLDGRIAAASGESRWITGEAARAEVQRLRARHDAVMIGAETARRDNPSLLVNADPEALQPARIVLTSRFELPVEGKLFENLTASPLIVFGAERGDAARRAILRDAGARVEPVAGVDTGVDIAAVLARLDALNFGRILVEGGGKLAATLIAADAVDRLEWFRAPIVLGAEGRPAVATLTVAILADAPRFKRVALRELGPDIWESYERVS
jgi:diaminohydroxyphosphoribosylaminopyrimidine deaminase / 5-amino-6-(5-phosphoribosylamino)uracil reductase